MPLLLSSYLVWVLVLVVSLVTSAASELIELSYTYNKGAPTSPKIPPFEHHLLKKGVNKIKLWVEEYKICASEHSGTHIDAPRHYSENGWTVEAIPTTRLWRIPAVVVDVSAIITKTRLKNYEVKAEDLINWEKLHGVIPDGALVFLHTGWGKMVNNYWSYIGLDKNNKLNFPGLGRDAAEWLVDHGKNNSHSIGVVGVGIDTLSLDQGQSVSFTTHATLFAANIYGLQNVANVDKLPPTGSFVTVMPMRIGGGSGAPARIIAEVGEDMSALASTHQPLLSYILSLLLILLRVL